ncbi:O-antigen ligase family protein [Flavobacteriaceae bacterium]|nr:O-antigen ligase family protein [Flavobacteriaceae bacterium]
MKAYYNLIFLPLLFPFLSYYIPLPEQILGFELTGVSWVYVFLVSIFFLYVTRKAKNKFPIIYWLPWVLYILGYIIFDFSFFGLQLTLQYLEFLIVGVIFSKLVLSDQNLLKIVTSLKWIVLIIGVPSIIVKLILNGWPLYSSNYVMTFSIIAAISLNTFYITKQKKYFFFYLMLFLFPIMEGTRMATLVFMCILLLNFKKIGGFRRIRVISLLAIMSLSIFYSESFQKKTFRSGSGEINDLYQNSSVLNDNGRTFWREILEDGIKSKPLFGNGPRKERAVILSFQDEITEAHNDYISVTYNYGYVGLSLLLFGFIATLIHLLSSRKKNYMLSDKLLWSSSAVLLTCFFIYMFTENILKYTFFYPNILFAMIGTYYSRINQRNRINHVL